MNKFLAWILTVGVTFFFEIVGYLLFLSLSRKAILDDDSLDGGSEPLDAQVVYWFCSAFVLVIVGLGSWLYIRSLSQETDQITLWPKMRNMIIGASGIGFVLTIIILIVSLAISFRG